MGGWIILETILPVNFLDFLWKYDLGWIFLCIVLIVGYQYLDMRIFWKEEITVKEYLAIDFYDKIFSVMIITGIILFLLERGNIMETPQLIKRLHMVPTGLVCHFLMYYFYPVEDSSREE